VSSNNQDETTLEQSGLTNDSIIDLAGFRQNVAIVVINDDNKVLFAKRRGMSAWQFPQGGIHPGETPEVAMYRELKEEIGLEPEDVELLGRSRGWLRYRLPHRMRRSGSPQCVGQKQIWYLLRLRAEDSAIKLDECAPPEFDSWEWVPYWYPLTHVVDFKRDVYSKGLKELLQAYFASGHRLH
tara:strand:+ start:49109 stop:49657 length:549 start_codon:yes stop_codon:yes gene_type:complete